MNAASAPLLSVHNLSVTFTMYEAGLKQKRLTVITDLDLDVRAGEIVAVLGSSGSGKSLLAHAILGILPKNAHVGGHIEFKGQPLTPKRQRELRGKHIALIPQSVAYLDPLMQVGKQVSRAGQLSGNPMAEARTAVANTFRRYGLAESAQRLFPYQLSGGMARRVLVSTAAIGKAELIIADEPTPGLHPDVVAETLSHLRELADAGKGVMLITHEIEAALKVADRVAIFYAGTTVEVARVCDFKNGHNGEDGENALRHPYTKALWRALPQHEFVAVSGAQPMPDALPEGCLFADRCPLVTPICRTARPPLRELRGGFVRCVHAV